LKNASRDSRAVCRAIQCALQLPDCVSVNQIALTIECGFIALVSEYPCTRLHKAALKFRLQGSKKSQNVSARFTIFFLLLFGNYCRIMQIR
jgi:hypothetical protein